VPGHQGLTGLVQRLLRGRAPSPAEEWRGRWRKAPPEELIRTHFAALVAHDLEWILATLAPERARLWNDPRTLDKRRATVEAAVVTKVEPISVQVPLPPFAVRYGEWTVWRVEFELTLVAPEQRRDPTLKEGPQWAYYILVRSHPTQGWLIADWGR
jgi:hypothetical protein